MFDAVLVALDRSQRAREALPAAVTVAGRLGVPLDLVTAIVPGNERRETEVREELEKVAGEQPVAVGRSVVAASGDIAAGILEAAGPATLVCMTTRGRGDATDLVVGSVAQDVLRRHDGATMLVGPRAAGADDFASVVACLDGSRAAEAVLPLAAGVAAGLGVPLELLQVLPLPGVRPDLPAAGSYLDALATRVHAAHGVEVVPEVRFDQRPAAAIERFLVERHNPVVAMTTRGRHDLPRKVLGSVALQVCHRSPGPVLLVRSARS
jgi:nucleotide-binding universal stress UspA family protein